MADKPHINPDHLVDLLRKMLRIRRFEEKCAELYSQQKIRGFLHLCVGQEAIAVGAMNILKPEDYIVSTYREHGHALARGLPIGKVLAEMYGKSNGCSRGRGGSMHLFDANTHFYGGNAIVGSGLPMAVGLAMAIKQLTAIEKNQTERAVAVCFFGEGAVAEGAFHESMNLAALWQLPLLFICENNRYAMGTALANSEAEQNIAAKAQGYGIDAQQVDGMNVVDVEAAVIAALKTVREQTKPYFLECLTYRFRGHSMFDTELYRDKAEVKQWQEKGPVQRLTHWLRDNRLLEDRQLARIESDISAEIEQAIEFAEQGEWEASSDLYKDVYSSESSL